jgi:hypothetical protein
MRDSALKKAAMKKERHGMEILWVVLFLAAWILLQAVILPRFGVPT